MRPDRALIAAWAAQAALLVLVPGLAWAGAEVLVQVAPVIDEATGEPDEPLTAKLQASLESHAAAGWKIVTAGSAKGSKCGVGSACLLVRVAGAGGKYSISITTPGGGKVGTGHASIPDGALLEDIADVLALKIILLAGNPKPKPNAKPKPEPKPPGPQPQPPEDPPAEGSPPAVDTVPKAAGVESGTAAAAPAAPAGRKAIAFRLALGAGYLTDFTGFFDEGGVDLGAVLVLYDVVGLKLQIGVGGKATGAWPHYVSMPVEVTVGWLGHFGISRIGVSIGLLLLPVWMSGLPEVEDGRKSDLLIGATGSLGVDFEVHRRLSIGIEVSPAYIAEEFVVLDEEAVKVFGIGNFMMGFSLRFLVNL